MEAIANRHELIKFTTQVQAEISDKITSDMILCKLGDQDKIGVTEMTVNAYLASRQIIAIKTKKEYIFNEEKQIWELKELPRTIIKYMEDIEEKIFKTYMTKVMMTAILNRNVDGNYLINVLSERREEEIEQERIEQPTDGTVRKLLKSFKNKEEIEGRK